MITTFLLTFAANVYSGLIGVLPSGSLPAGVSSAITTAVRWLYVADPIMDVSTLLTILGLYFAIEVGIQVVQFFFWAYSKIPVFGK